MRQVTPPECEIAVAVPRQMCEPRHCFVKVRNMPGLDRPQHEMRPRQCLEPFGLAIVELLVHRRPNEALQRFNTFPHRQVDRRGWVSRGADRGCIVALVLEAPHESLAALCESVDPVEIPHKPRHPRIVRRIAEPADVELGDMARHALLRRWFLRPGERLSAKTT